MAPNHRYHRSKCQVPSYPGETCKQLQHFPPTPALPGLFTTSLSCAQGQGPHKFRECKTNVWGIFLEGKKHLEPVKSYMQNNI